MTLKNSISDGAEVMPASISARILKKHSEKGLADLAPHNIQWRILSGKSRYPEHLPFLSSAAAIFRVSSLFSILDALFYHVKRIITYICYQLIEIWHLHIRCFTSPFSHYFSVVHL